MIWPVVPKAATPGLLVSALVPAKDSAHTKTNGAGSSSDVFTTDDADATDVVEPSGVWASLPADTAHQMTHDPKSNKCEVCLRGKIQRKQERRRGLVDMGP